jgi:hypothetical protein
MTVAEMINQLTLLREHGLAGTSVVKAYNGDTEQLEEVTGFLYCDESTEICTDEN